MRNLFSHCLPAKLKAWEEQQACWDSQRSDLEQRVEDGEEKAEKLEKYVCFYAYHRVTVRCAHAQLCLRECSLPKGNVEKHYEDCNGEH